MNARDIEIAVACFVFPYRLYTVVPNVSWGLGIHECDLLAVSKSGYANEVEIKISVGDCKKDLKKRHGHRNTKIKHLWFAMPRKIIEKCLPYIPERAGIIEVYFRECAKTYHARKIRAARIQKGTRPLSALEITKLQRLLNLRFWNNLQILTRRCNELKQLKGNHETKKKRD